MALRGFQHEDYCGHCTEGCQRQTTLAVHMAVCAIRQSLRTALIDPDPQGSAHDWNESREDGEKLGAVKAGSGQPAALLKQAKAAGADLVIVDTAPHSDSAAAMVARRNRVIMPNRSSAGKVAVRR
jgi:chromosome partitioning protein